MTERQRAHELVLRATFGATPDQVFGWMTEPARLVMWWGPDGFSTPEALFDPVVGRGYRLTMQPPEGSPFHLAGAFLEVDAPLRLSYTFRWEEPLPDDRETVVALTLHPVDDGTEVVLSQHGFASRERLELHRHGWTQAFRRLQALIGFPASGVLTTERTSSIGTSTDTVGSATSEPDKSRDGEERVEPDPARPPMTRSAHIAPTPARSSPPDGRGRRTPGGTIW